MSIKSLNSRFQRTSFRRFDFERLEDRRLLAAGVTVITHGAQFFSSGLPDWTVTLGQAILDRADGPLTAHNVGSMFQHDPASGRWQPVASSVWSNSNKPDEAIVLLYDWASESGALADGWLEGAADNLFASVLDANDYLPGALAGRSFVELALEAGGGGGLLDMHFIGHSRGAVLNSLVVERFDAYLPDLTIDQVTTLDPHPAAPMNDPGYVSASPSTNSRVFTYENVRFADNYFQQDGSYEPLLPPDFDGVPADGAYNFQIPSAVLRTGGGSLNHTDTHTWYYGTVTATLPADYAGFSGAGRNNDGDVSFPESWWDASGVPARTATGFAFSEIGGAKRSELPVSGSKSKSGVVETVFNGDFHYGASGWTGHGGGGTAAVSGGDDQYLQLGSGGDNYFRRHNPVYFDRYADGVQYDYEVSTVAASGADDLLQVLVDGSVVDVIPLTGVNSDFVRDREAKLGFAHAGFVAAIEFRIVDVAGDGVESMVRVDNVSLIERAADVDADVNRDAQVDGADFLTWQRGLGNYMSATRSQGDANDDGNVLADDLAVWRSAFDGAQDLSVQENAASRPQGLSIETALQAWALGGAGAAEHEGTTMFRWAREAAFARL
jgi:hypothetical protein